MSLVSFGSALLSSFLGLFLVGGTGSPSALASSTMSHGTYDFSFEGQDYTAAYSITQGEVTKIVVDEALATTLVVLSNASGTFEISFSRQFMTSFKLSPEFADYHEVEIFVDTIPVKPEIKANCESVIFTIEIEQGTEEIEFLGVSVAADLPPSPTPERYSFLHRDVTAKGDPYSVRVTSNVDACKITLMEQEKKFEFNIRSGSEDQVYFGVAIPHSVLGGNYTVLLDGIEVNHTAIYLPAGSPQSEAHEDVTLISVSYEAYQNPRQLEIIGTSVIPEFGWTIILVLFSSSGMALVLARYFGRISRFPPQ